MKATPHFYASESVMPQPLPAEKKVRSDYDLILERKELAALIGNIASNWTQVEETIMFLYALLLGTDLPHAEDGAPRPHPVAFQIFTSLYALDRRVDLLERLLKSRADPKEAEDFERRLKPLLSKRFRERSTLVHGVWGVCDDYPDALILYAILEKPMIYKAKDLQDVCDRIRALGDELSAFGEPIYKRFVRPTNALYRPESPDPAQPHTGPENDSDQK